MNFFLGTHEASWLGRTGVDLFLSRRRLARQKKLPRAIGNWSLDSGGFTELNLHGRWETTPQCYADDARRFSAEVGRMKWAAIQDWMCEPFVLAKTGKTIPEHQELSTASLVDLRSLAPEIPWCPVLQGFAIDDYFAHLELYRKAGFDLTREPIVGVGSVCRRQGTRQAVELFRSLHAAGLRLHGFGLKIQGLKGCSGYLESSDSLAWSYAARRSAPLPGCLHAACANCLHYALKWRDRVVQIAERPFQLGLFGF